MKHQNENIIRSIRIFASVSIIHFDINSCNIFLKEKYSFDTDGNSTDVGDLTEANYQSAPAQV